ncbi:ribosome silencing factor [Acidovorax sp. SUPP2522]|uniref:ribosome silencing factor n=1 Tax=unclassified Acidovorax TaxID=2684926 RepID=UPI00234A7971|nr:MULTISPECIES: ribosome silencing factor [unclassified Acidovorax]WCM95584.1 ribosome silencing factor [Acidovorax sp. GBBC 1281]GKT17777.1 ribosome silencing factor [Acidovorax sp. SUPP2522]
MTTSSKSESAAKKDVTKLQRAIVDGLEDVKAQDIQVFNTEHLSPLFERVIVASGTSNRQTKALAASVRDAVREAGFGKPRIEGEDNGEWIIVDCGAAVAHIMQPAIRQYYRLEEIWGDTPVRLKLGAAKPKAVEGAAGTAKKKPAAKKAAAAPEQPPRKPGVSKVAAKAPAAKAPAKTAAKTTGKPAGRGAVKQAAPAKTTAKTAAKTTAKPVAKAPIKTLVVKPIAKKTAGKPAAKKAPGRSTAAAAPKAAPRAGTVKTAAKQRPAAKKSPTRRG